MYVGEAHDRFDAARLALLAYAGAPPRLDLPFVDARVPLDPRDEVDAILTLDAAGAVDAVLHSDWLGNRRWRARIVTPAGREVARLVRDELVWNRLKFDLSQRGDPFAQLVAGYRDNLTMQSSG